MNNFEKTNRIDELEKKLYSPNHSTQQRARKPLRAQEFNVPQDWDTPHLDTQDTALVDKGEGPNWFFRFFVLAFIFFIGALGYVGIKLYLTGGVDASNVDILVNAPLTISAGEPLELELSIQNKNQVTLRSIDLEIQFPDGTRTVTDVGVDQKSVSETIDSIAVGEIVKRNHEALLFGEEGEKKEITIGMVYQIDEATTVFRKEKKIDVIIKSTPVRLTVTNVKEITSGQELVFGVELVSNSTQTLKNVMVQATYPFGFRYTGSSLSPQEDKKTWIIPTLAPKETITFDVKGTIAGQNNDDTYFTFLVGLEDPGKNAPQVVFSSKNKIVSIARPFLDVDLTINDSSASNIVLDPEVLHTANLSFRNNTGSSLQNVAIALLIEGSSIYKDSIRVAEGFYQSLTNTIAWDQTTSKSLELIAPGASGGTTFTFQGLGDKSDYITINPEATFTINVKANRNPENQVSDFIENSFVKKIRFNTEVKLEGMSEYYSSVFTNSGPIPPKAEQKTTYTALLSLQNTSNAISGGVVTMRLPNYVQYEGQHYPTTETITYDKVTRLVTWNVGTIAPKTGYAGGASRRLAFQVSIVPSISQAGSSPDLVENITLRGVDAFTQAEIEKRINSITTQIKDARDFYSSQVSR